MNHSAYLVDHVRFTTTKPFEAVRADFERQVGRVDADAYKASLARGDFEATRAAIEAMAGPSGFMVFAIHDHGSLLSMVGLKRKALQYMPSARACMRPCGCCFMRTTKARRALNTIVRRRSSASSATTGSAWSRRRLTRSWSALRRWRCNERLPRNLGMTTGRAKCRHLPVPVPSPAKQQTSSRRRGRRDPPCSHHAPRL
jgi:hypothetical protein